MEHNQKETKKNQRPIRETNQLDHPLQHLCRDLREEGDLVPYEPSPLPPGPWLVLAPHPDDETLGLGGSLALAARAGLPVQVVCVTDGERAGRAATRRSEARRALKTLGLPEPLFWGLPDRQVSKCQDFFVQKLQKLKVQKFKTIFVPSFLEFHPDHRAVLWFTLAFLRLLSWPGELWCYEISRTAEVNRLVVIDAVMEVKERALRCYRSQLREAPYLELARARGVLRAYTLSWRGFRAAEGFLAARPGDLLETFFGLLEAYFP